MGIMMNYYFSLAHYDELLFFIERNNAGLV